MKGGARTQRRRPARERRVVVRGVRRRDIDTRKLARALIAVVRTQAEVDARAAHESSEGARDD